MLANIIPPIKIVETVESVSISRDKTSCTTQNNQRKFPTLLNTRFWNLCWKSSLLVKYDWSQKRSFVKNATSARFQKIFVSSHLQNMFAKKKKKKNEIGKKIFRPVKSASLETLCEMSNFAFTKEKLLKKTTAKYPWIGMNFWLRLGGCLRGPKGKKRRRSWERTMIFMYSNSGFEGVLGQLSGHAWFPFAKGTRWPHFLS